MSRDFADFLQRDTSKVQQCQTSPTQTSPQNGQSYRKNQFKAQLYSFKNGIPQSISCDKGSFRPLKSRRKGHSMKLYERPWFAFSNYCIFVLTGKRTGRNKHCQLNLHRQLEGWRIRNSFFFLLTAVRVGFLCSLHGPALGIH